MAGQFEVELRGKTQLIVVDRDYGYEPDTNAHEVEWHLEPPLDPFTDEPLTDEEEEKILEQVYEYLRDRDYDEP